MHVLSSCTRQLLMCSSPPCRNAVMQLDEGVHFPEPLRFPGLPEPAELHKRQLVRYLDQHNEPPDTLGINCPTACTFETAELRFEKY